MNIMEFTPQMIIQWLFTMFNTVALILILAKILYQPVLGFLRDRKERIARNIDEANRMHAEADEYRSVYEVKLRDVEKERSMILEQTKKDALERERAIITEAKNEALLILNRANVEIEREKEKSKDLVKTQIVEISSMLAGLYVKEKIDSATQTKILNEIIDELGEKEWLS